MDDPKYPLHVLIMAPVGRDAELLRDSLQAGGLVCQICGDTAQFEEEARHGAGLLLLTEEALTPRMVQLLRSLQETQPAWSEMPTVVLSDAQVEGWRGQEPYRSLLDASGVTVLTRPIARGVLHSVVRTSLQTRRRQYEVRDLLEQLAYHAELLENIHDAVVATDLERRVTAWNRAAERMYGWTREEALGHSVDELIESDFDPERRAAAMEELTTTGRYTTEVVIKAKDGVPIQVESVAVPIRDEVGEIAGFVSASRDISERARAEAAIRESEARLRFALQTGHLGAWEMDLVSEEMKTSKRCKADFGLAPEDDLTYRRLMDELIHPEDRDRILGEARRALEEHSDYAAEYRTIWPDGSVHWIQAHGRAIYDEADQPVRMIGLTVDITARKAAEEALRESERRFRGTFENVAVGISHVDFDGSWLRVNQTLCDIVGYSRSEMLERTFQDITYPDDLSPDLELFDQLKRGEIDSYQMEKRYFHKDGYIVWIHLTATLQRDEQGEPLYCIAVIQDISERKEAEEKLRAYSHTLEILNRVSRALAAELDLETVVQAVTDATTELSGAQFGAFFYNREDSNGQRYMLYTLSGVPREAFASFPFPRNTPLFAPTFRGEGVVRLDDVTQAPAYGQMGPHFGMPEGHLPVRSYMAVPVVRRDGYPIGGLFFGHAEPGVFSEQSEDLISGIVAHAAVAIDNARLHTELRESEERFRVMAETVPNILFTCQPDGQMDYLNRRFAAVTGISTDEGLGTGWLAAVVQPDLESLKWQWREAERVDQPVTDEICLRTHDGGERWFMGRAHPVRNEEGEIIKWVGTATDIHDLKQAEEALRRAKNDLERRVQERTGELVRANTVLQEEIRERRRAEGELAEVRRRLSRSREAERMHLARELHDGPIQELTGLQFALSSLSHGLGPEQQDQITSGQEKLKEISQTLRQITNDLRPPVLAHFGLSAAVRAYVEEFSHNHPELRVSHQINGEEQALPEETGLALYRICQQALYNVVQHAEADEIDVRLCVQESSLLLEVADNGIGFEVPAHWVELARSGHLGLAGMAERAEAVDGDFTVESEPGRGTTIRLRLPLAKQATANVTTDV